MPDGQKPKVPIGREVTAFDADKVKADMDGILKRLGRALPADHLAMEGVTRLFKDVKELVEDLKAYEEGRVEEQKLNEDEATQNLRTLIVMLGDWRNGMRDWSDVQYEIDGMTGEREN